VSLRDPVDRYLSGLGLQFGAASLADGSTLNAVPSDAVLRSLYSPQMTQLRRFFPRSQILILQFERCVLDPESELRRTYEFLNIDPEWTPREIRRLVNRGGVRGSHRFDEEKKSLAEFLEEDVRRLAAEYPEIDLRLWPNFAHLAAE